MVDKLVKDEFNVNIDDSVDWDADRNVGAEVNRGNISGVGGHIGAKVLRSDGKRVEI